MGHRLVRIAAPNAALQTEVSRTKIWLILAFWIHTMIRQGLQKMAFGTHNLMGGKTVYLMVFFLVMA